MTFTDIFDILLDKQDKAFKEAVMLHKTQAEVHKSVFSHECTNYASNTPVKNSLALAKIAATISQAPIVFYFPSFLTFTTQTSSYFVLNPYS